MSITGKVLALSVFLLILHSLKGIAAQLHLNDTFFITINGTDYFELLSGAPIEPPPFSGQYTIHLIPRQMPRFRFDTTDKIELFWHDHLISGDVKPDSQWFFSDRFCEEVRSVIAVTKPSGQFFVIPYGKCEAITESDKLSFMTLTFRQPPRDLSLSKPTFDDLFGGIPTGVDINPMPFSDSRLAVLKMQQRAYLENPDRFVSRTIEVNIVYLTISAKLQSFIPNYETLVEVVSEAESIEALFRLVIDALQAPDYIDHLAASRQDDPTGFISEVTSQEGIVNLQKLVNYIKALIKKKNPGMDKEQRKAELGEAIQVMGDRQHHRQIQKNPSPPDEESTLSEAAAVLPSEVEHLTVASPVDPALGLINELISTCNHAINPIVTIIFNLNPYLAKAYGRAKRYIRNKDGTINAQAILKLLQNVPDLEEKLKTEIHKQTVAREEAQRLEYWRWHHRRKKPSSQGFLKKKD